MLCIITAFVGNVMGVVAEDTRNRVLHEILYADDLVLASESVEDLQRKFSLWDG